MIVHDLTFSDAQERSLTALVADTKSMSVSPLKTQEDSAQCIAVKTFGWAEQDEFARESGDSNPMHMDPVAARRTQAGRPVIHGMNAALWAVDQLATHGWMQRRLAEWKTKFRRLMHVGETVSVWVARETDARLSAELRVGDTVTSTLTLTWGEWESATEFEDFAGESGEFAVNVGAVRMYPALSQTLGEERVAFLVGLSRLVGMEVPGLHSIFTSFQVRFRDTGCETGLRFHVDDTDDRFRLVNLSVRGNGVTGTVAALARMPPVQQPAIGELAGFVDPLEFRGVTALIVGGSRGLGELAAKIIAAGGGRVVVTYAVGKEEAEAVQREIRAWGGVCGVMQYDVTKAVEEQLKGIANAPSQFYYFATNPIFKRVDAAFSPTVFRDFCQFYITGFYDLCAALSARGTRDLRVLYPSSVAVAERPDGMTEYAMAKTAGELLCEDLGRTFPKVKITVTRLPRLATDQTVTTQAMATEDPVQVLLPLIRAVQRSENRVDEGVAALPG